MNLEQDTGTSLRAPFRCATHRCMLTHAHTHALMDTCLHMLMAPHTHSRTHAYTHTPTNQACAEDGHVSEGWCAREGEPVKGCSTGDQRKAI